MITIAIIITTILAHIIAFIQEIPETMRKATQAVKSTTTRISCSKLFQSIKKSYKTAGLAITIVTNTMDHTSRMNQHQTANRNTQKIQGTQKLKDKYDGLSGSINTKGRGPSEKQLKDQWH